MIDHSSASRSLTVGRECAYPKEMLLCAIRLDKEGFQVCILFVFEVMLFTVCCH